jgi:hypothetical protein
MNTQHPIPLQLIRRALAVSVTAFSFATTMFPLDQASSQCTSNNRSSLAHPSPTFQRADFFQADMDFIIGTGKADASVAFGYCQDHQPGYLLSSLNYSVGRGVPLPRGIYLWTFRVRRGSEPLKFPGSPAFRLSVWDVTASETLTERVLHASAFESANVDYDKSLIHSSLGREGHRFEPRVYWESFMDDFVDCVAPDGSEINRFLSHWPS